MKGKIRMITKYSTEGCSACKKLGILLDQLKVEYNEVNISENIEIAEEKNIHRVPTLIDDEGNRLEGIVTLSELKEFCKIK